MMDNTVALVVTASLVAVGCLGWLISKWNDRGYREDAKDAFRRLVVIPDKFVAEFRKAKTEEEILKVSVRIAKFHGVWAPGSIVKAVPEFEKAMGCLATAIYNETRYQRANGVAQRPAGLTPATARALSRDGASNMSNVPHGRRRDNGLDEDDADFSYRAGLYAASTVAAADDRSYCAPDRAYTSCHSSGGSSGHSSHHCSSSDSGSDNGGSSSSGSGD